MVAKASIIEIYARADAAGKVDIICKNYSNFIGIVDGYTEGLRYMIESEKAYNRKKMGFSQGVDISFLSEEAQQWVEVIIEEQGCNVSIVQSGKLKEYGKSGELTLAMVRLILTEEKPKERKVTLKADKISKYFSDSYSNEEIENIIISLLDKWREEGAV